MRTVLALVMCAGCRLHFDDAGSDAAPTVCELSTTLVCDDFSSPPSMLAGEATWLPTGGRTGGGLGVHGISNVTYSDSFYLLPTTLTSGELHLRFYANVSPGGPVSLFEVMGELNNGIDTGGQQKVSADLFAGDLYTVSAPFSGGGPASTSVMQRGSWTCIEVYVVIDPSAGSVHLSVNGTEVAARSGLNTLIPMGFKRALLSAVGSSSDPEFSATYDDFVVAVAPIGC